MFTPKQIQEQTFSKAVFGGYDMQQVDDFLEPLTEDYITLYKENSVLKSKMKILVEKLEEYRAQEAANQSVTMKQPAQNTAEQDAARAQADEQTAALQASIAQEQERLQYARQAALNFIDVVEHDIRGHLELLDTLKNRDLGREKKEEDEARNIASQISENLGKLMADEEPAAEESAPAVKSVHPESKTILYDDLKFGRNYDPTNR